MVFGRYIRTGNHQLADTTTLSDDGIIVNRLKGSKSNIVKWSPRLRAVVTEAMNTETSCKYLLHNDKGERITKEKLRNPWDKMMKAAKRENPNFEPFARHDLKAKDISDQVIHQNSAGHRFGEMQEIYKRKLEKVEPPK